MDDGNIASRSNNLLGLLQGQVQGQVQGQGNKNLNPRNSSGQGNKNLNPRNSSVKTFVNANPPGMKGLIEEAVVAAVRVRMKGTCQ